MNPFKDMPYYLHYRIDVHEFERKLIDWYAEEKGRNGL
jgi:hypothetical protein